ncbi:hypothetical protein [Nocardioides sp. Kera G14]|uniref:hypothetical protein n=1 Tax=Nocardioides sp. Kera G14 TaxID=2884264 RepID=UPI001D12F8DE|nr:hypothetical protein [Nocardioides sp. Kera G14]UDY23928.1 hypothetical protein LH076_01110 [Nocardioides sp. Kera G14]
MTSTDIDMALDLLINDPALAEIAAAALASDDGVGPVVASPLRPVHKGFRAFVDQTSFDVSEIAIVTLLQAVAFDKDVLFLPLTALGRQQHQTLISAEPLDVTDLAGRTGGVRAWSQTTGVWVRGILAEQHGVDLSSITWRTYSRGHVPEQAEPPFVTPAEEGASLADDLLSGRVDFAIMGNDRPDDARIRSIIPEPAAAAAAWSVRTGFVPVNHVIAARGSTARAVPGAILAMYDALAADLEARNADRTGPPLNPVGFAALRPAVESAARFAEAQGLLPRPVVYDELVERTSVALGVSSDRLGA